MLLMPALTGSTVLSPSLHLDIMSVINNLLISSAYEPEKEIPIVAQE